MTPERWERLEQAFADAAGADGTARRDVLARLAQADPSLHAELEPMLAAHARDAVLDGAAADLLPPPEAPSARPAGTRLGAYSLVGLIGRGGMGEVYRARRADAAFDKDVALKLVRVGFDTGYVLARFRSERQILAGLDHPGIARLLDGGTSPDGLPYLVMELVDGRPIDEYCRTAGLDLHARLTLFRAVCDAVSYAHRQLVVHRDLKPGNILVTPGGDVKLLDFGVAKLLEPPTASAPAGGPSTTIIAMTPEFASPEQVLGRPVTVASDVYSLGVVLYHLLAGRSPYAPDTRSTAAAIRAVCESDPEPPSRVRADAHRFEIARDLDDVVLKALRKEPADRYASVEQLSADVARYLAGRPVLAHGTHRAYVARKFVARHRSAVLAAALAVTALVVGAGLALREARQSAQERARAERALAEARAANDWTLSQLYDAIEKLPGSGDLRYTVLRRTLERLDRLARESGDDPATLDAVALGYERLGKLQMDTSVAGLGTALDARDSYLKGAAIRESLARRRPDDARNLEHAIELLAGARRADLHAARLGDALAAAQRAVTLADRLAPIEARDPGARRAVARAHAALATVLAGGGSSASLRRVGEGVAEMRRAVAVLEAPGASDDTVEEMRLLYRIELAGLYGKARRFDDAQALFESIDGELARLGAGAWRLRAQFLDRRETAYGRAGDFGRGLAASEALLREVRPHVERDPNDRDAEVELVVAEGNHAMLSARLGRVRDAGPELDRALARVDRMLAANPPNRFYDRLRMFGHAYRAEIHFAAREYAAAEERYRAALAIATAHAASVPDDLVSVLSIARLELGRAVVAARAGERAAAAERLAAARRAITDLVSRRPDDGDAREVDREIGAADAALSQCNSGRCVALTALELPVLAD
jgi:non-specific serine/threonine protein kinase/serine/threonine-protein kinase